MVSENKTEENKASYENHPYHYDTIATLVVCLSAETWLFRTRILGGS